MKLKIIHLLFLVLCASTATAQSLNIQSDNITWTINGMTDLNADVTVSYQCKFVTHGIQSVDWIQENGNFIMHFTVFEANGNWSDVAQDGSVTFTISGEGLAGQFTITRSSSGLSGALNLSGGTFPINHTYPIQSYEKL